VNQLMLLGLAVVVGAGLWFLTSKAGGGGGGAPSATRYGVRGEEKLAAADLALVEELAAELGTDPRNLLAVISFETAQSFSPSKRNPLSNATGLIQFMPDTAKMLGTTIDALAKMSFAEQWPYVRRFFGPEKYKGKVTDLLDLYLAVFWPAGVGASKGDDYVLIDKNSPKQAKAHAQNEGLDFNKNGQITRGEVRRVISNVLTKPSEAAPAPAASGRVLVLGDSLAFGIGQQLAAQSSKATNRGKPSTIVKSIQPDPAEVKGARVVVATATNDLAGTRELADIAAELEGLTEKLSEADTLRVFVPLHPLAKEPLRGRAQAFADLLRQRDRFAPGVLVDDPTPDRDRSSDGIHYTPAGYARLGKLLTAAGGNS
jgi:lysophospholipase L1-like esterase